MSGCIQCKSLLDEASDAISRHIRAIGRLDMALLNDEKELIPSLEIVVKEASLKRENAVAAYRHHIGQHRAMSSGTVA